MTNRIFIAKALSLLLFYVLLLHFGFCSLCCNLLTNCFVFPTILIGKYITHKTIIGNIILYLLLSFPFKQVSFYDLKALWLLKVYTYRNLFMTNLQLYRFTFFYSIFLINTQLDIINFSPSELFFQKDVCHLSST